MTDFDTLTRLFRSCLVARPGHKLVRADHGAAEAVLTGWFAGDPEYIRLCKLGIHSYTMARHRGIPIDLTRPDAEIIAQLEQVKKLDKMQYRRFKTVRYGSTYLAGPRKVFEQNPEDLSSTREAKELQKFVIGLHPLIQRFQQGILQQTIRWTPEHRWGWRGNDLVNPFGYLKSYWDMKGGDGPAAVAGLVQSTEACIMKECMLELMRRNKIGDRDYRYYSGEYLIWQIHDELVCDVPISYVDVVKQELITVMGQPWPQLGGLAIPVDVKVSESLA